MLLGSSLVLNSCSIFEHFLKRESVQPIQTEPLVLDANQGNDISLPEFGQATIFDPESFVAEYKRVAEVASLFGEGDASWYGPNFHGRLTANGERYDMHELTAAHPTLPFNTQIWVENKNNGRAVLVRINDRGPYASGRIIDLSRGAAKELGIIGSGLAKVTLYLTEEETEKAAISESEDPSYTIQLGTFESGKEALRYSRSIEGSRVEIVDEQNKMYYGVFYGLYADRREALQKQRQLQQQGEYTSFVKQLATG